MAQYNQIDGETINVNNPVLFYRERDKYGEFSNFSKHPVTIKGLVWPTTEHYFQAMKFEGSPFCEEIRTIDAHPSTAKKLGQSRHVPLRADWEQVKDDIMIEALFAKFTQYAPLGELLLGTGNRLIVEHTTNDRYWGDGGDGSGSNKLGYCLMKVRAMLRQRAAPGQVEQKAPVAPSDKAEEESSGQTNTAESSSTQVDENQSQTRKQASSVRRGKSKGQRKRAVFSDADGTPIFDKSSANTVNVQGTQIQINSRALTPSARLVVHQYQHTKKREGIPSFEEDDESDEDFGEDEPDYHQSQKTRLGDYLGTPSTVEDPLASLANLQESIQSALELIQSLDPTDPASTTLKESIIAEMGPSKAKLISALEASDADSATTTAVLALLEKVSNL